MKTLMYPIAPEDDFPEMFCAIRQGGGECQFYTPEGESASWMLFRAESENAKLREFAKEACEMARSFYNLGGTFNDLDDLLCEASELGVEVSNE